MRRPRSEDLLSAEKARAASAHIIGAGAIGSNVGEYLARMGVGTITLYDDDTVEELNIEPQVYIREDVGALKTEALAQFIGLVDDDANVWEHVVKWTARDIIPEGTDFVIGAVDSMDARRDIAVSLQSSLGNWNHYIDGRMGANIIEVYHVTPATLKDYYNDGVVSVEPLDIPCSMRSIAYNGRVCAALIARQVAAALNGEPIPNHVHFDMLAWSFNTEFYGF